MQGHLDIGESPQGTLLSAVTDAELLSQMRALVSAERAVTADVIEHLIEIDRRKLFLDQACSSLYAYCIERLGYSEDSAFKRVRVARLAARLPQVLGELRSGTLHLTGLFLLSTYLTDHNASILLAEARGKSRSGLERLIAHHFPRPDVAPRIERLPESLSLLTEGSPRESGRSESAEPCPKLTRPEQGERQTRARLKALSPARFHVEFTASETLYDKINHAKQLFSHSLPSGDLATLLERALDLLIEAELRRRTGAHAAHRKRRALKPGSRHVPLEVARDVWKRDGARCAFVGGDGSRCEERMFLTLEHRRPYALGGAATVENVCLLCAAHNAHRARRVFGDTYLKRKRAERAMARIQRAIERSGADTPMDVPGFVAPTDSDLHGVAGADRAQLAAETICARASIAGYENRVFSALCALGFGMQPVTRVMASLRETQETADEAALLRAALLMLVPATRPS
jgi:hypothetical protein